MSTVASVLTKVGYKIFESTNQSITATSEPSTAECLAWLNEGVEVLSNLLVERRSQFGQSTKKITTAKSFLIESITQANPGVVTVTEDHGLSSATTAYLSAISGMIQLNNTTVTITVADTDAFSIGVDTSAYDEYTGNGIANPKPYYNDFAAAVLATTHWATCFYGANKYPMELVAYQESQSYSPMDRGRPEAFHIDATGNIYLLPQAADDTYIIEIPYWPTPTELTSGSTMPFGGLFDNYLVQGVVNAFMNRAEYSIDYELFWSDYLLRRVKNLIKNRKTTLRQIRA